MSKRTKSFNVHLDYLKAQYLDMCGPRGGDALGYRQYVQNALDARPDLIEQHRNELIANSANSSWRKQPRENGPDLFSIAGIACPEYLTRPTTDRLGEGDEHGDGFKKVSLHHATVNDLADDAQVKARKAAEAGAAAAKRYEM